MGSTPEKNCTFKQGSVASTTGTPISTTPQHSPPSHRKHQSFPCQNDAAHPPSNLFKRGKRRSRRKIRQRNFYPLTTTSAHSEQGGAELTPTGPISASLNFSNTANEDSALIKSYLRQQDKKQNLY
jgi:hypothetical protein